MQELESGLGNERWVNRQTFACLCHRLYTAQVMPEEEYGEEILPMLVNLAWDIVPNVRITVAKSLHAISQSGRPRSDPLQQFLCLPLVCVCPSKLLKEKIEKKVMGRLLKLTLQMAPVHTTSGGVC